MFAHDTPRKTVQTPTFADRKSVDSFSFGAHSGDVEAQLHSSVNEFRVIAEPLYRRDPVVHTIELTLLATASFPDDSFLMTVWDDGTAVGAALQTPPYPLACNGIPPTAIDPVVADLAGLRPGLGGVRGVRNAAVAFADSWHAVPGRSGRVSTEQRLYRLGALSAPGGVAGSARLATADDRSLLVDWVGLFFDEAFSPVHDDGGEEFVDTADRVGHRVVLWAVDGAPASMAMRQGPAGEVSRIGPVFTPPTERGRGYGSAVTAAAADLAHRSGTPDVVLFADLANPTSNAIYQRIGFEAVADTVRI